jgi:molybdopterin-containing oxidoreductase family iron-sulfur binding subunit
MVIDLDKCTACQACVVACQTENNVPSMGPEESEMGRSIYWMKVAAFPEGEVPRGKVRFLPLPCLHCDNPPCVTVCPVDATNITPDGIVRQIFSRCIGCRYCTTACPYTRRYFNWYAPEWPEPMSEAQNPDVSVRPKGVVEKCTFCHHRLQKARAKAIAEQRPLAPGEYVPACVESCPARAMVFGDLDDPNSAVAQLARSGRAFRLLEELGTQPKVIYLAEGERHGASSG